FGEEREPLVTGNPVRSDLVAAGSRPHYDYDGTRPLRLLVLGGSLGAAPINVILPGTLRRMLRDRHGSLEVWHQTGTAHHEEMEGRYAGMRDVSAKVVPFIEDMAAAYQWADVVLCRAGALTVSELAVMGRPSILVPLPQAVDDHQTLNAKWLANTGAAFVMLQSQLDAYSLGDLLERLMDDPQELAAMSEAAYAAATPDATRRIADCCEELIHGG
ncbi:MAG: glycosyltransferase, partial [Halioglobus sp.]|nr:glycosyltransferase [Halioglobus sp.]